MSTGYLFLYAGVAGVVLTALLAVALAFYFPRKKKRVLKKIREDF